jgi:predicted transglutaminase-like cysteine proteinase
MRLLSCKTLILWVCLLSPPAAFAGPPASPTDGYNTPAGVFQSVAIPVSSFPAARKWKEVLPSVEAADFAHCAHGNECAALGRVIEEVLAADLRRKLDAINRAVNHLVRYLPDDGDGGSGDIWASPAETLARGAGDCEDYAILKMSALKQAGVPMEDMSVVVVRDIRRNLYHAVLSVMTDDGYFILDNLSGKVMPDRWLHTYTPLYSVGAAGAWIHGSRTDRSGAGAS